MKTILIRHGKTEGNLKKRYIGVTDESLCEEGIRELNALKKKYSFSPDFLYVSPLKRCRETAAILFPYTQQIIVPDLRECNFGTFENKNYIELSDNPDYQSWIDSNGMLPFPEGESREEFQERCINAFLDIVEKHDQKQALTIAFVVHGGTIMSIMNHINTDIKKSYFDFQVKNGESFTIEHMIALRK